MRLIDADKYCDFLNNYPLEKAQNNFMIFYRDALQYTFECEVDAEPVKHGHWEEFHCSVCGEIGWDNEDKYCPNCGAKMDGGENEANAKY